MDADRPIRCLRCSNFLRRQRPTVRLDADGLVPEGGADLLGCSSCGERYTVPVVESVLRSTWEALRRRHRATTNGKRLVLDLSTRPLQIRESTRGDRARRGG